MGDELHSGRVRQCLAIKTLARACMPLCIMMLLVSCLPAGTLIGNPRTSRAVREKAILEIPFSGLTPDARQKITAVVKKPSMFRRMPTNLIDCDPDLYRFLIRHPEVVVNIWQLMGITKVAAKRIGPYLLDTSDGVGTTSNVELVYGTNDTHLIYCEGAYDGPLFRRPLTGRCVLLLKSGYVKTNDDRWHISSQMDVFVQVDHAGADVLTKTLHPLLGSSADTNFVESMKFLERITRTSEQNETGMARLAARLDQVDEATRTKFAKLSLELFTENQERIARLAAAATVNR